MNADLESALLTNIKGSLGLTRDLSGHEARRVLRVVLYTLRREGFAISRVAAPGQMMPVVDVRAG